MLMIQNTLVSDDIVREQFKCNLTACKGACCWEGDFGAPLELEELDKLKEIYPAVRPFLSPAGQAAIDRQGTAIYYEDNDSFGTPLIDNGPCAYMIKDRNGIAKCGIEQAQRAGVIDYLKPVSCHLYPIRVSVYPQHDYEVLNYDRWDICKPACSLGKQEKLPVYVFLKDAIIRRYGRDYYDELDAAAATLLKAGSDASDHAEEM